MSARTTFTRTHTEHERGIMPASKKNTNNDAPKTYSVSQLATAVAASKGIETDRAAKMVRSRLRANFAAVAATCPNVAQAKTAANDGNRWPTNMDARIHAFIVDGDKSALASVDA